MKINFDKLNNGLKLSIVKKKQKIGSQRTASMGYSRSGQNYLAGNISSDTNMHDITSEQAVLVLAVQNNDFQIDSVVTLVESPNPQQIVSPLVIKILIDYQIRAGATINYTLIDKKENVLFKSKDITKLMSFYNPPINPLSKTKKSNISKNYITLNHRKNIKPILKEYALLGIERNFPTYDSATGYGVSVLTDKNNLYFGGQYSSFDKRIGLHAEMATVINALMSGKKEKITHLGVVSTKYGDEPCQICGCCRQFLSEIIQRNKTNINFFCFAKDNNLYNKYSIDQLLPSRWSSMNW